MADELTSIYDDSQTPQKPRSVEPALNSDFDSLYSDKAPVAPQRTAQAPKPRNREQHLEAIRAVNPEFADTAQRFIDFATAKGLNDVDIRSGYRTAAEQNYLDTHGYPTKGNDGYVNISPHQQGRAIDWTTRDPGNKQRLHDLMQIFLQKEYERGNKLHIPSDEPWHMAAPKSRTAPDPGLNDLYGDTATESLETATPQKTAPPTAPLQTTASGTPTVAPAARNSQAAVDIRIGARTAPAPQYDAGNGNFYVDDPRTNERVYKNSIDDVYQEMDRRGLKAPPVPGRPATAYDFAWHAGIDPDEMKNWPRALRDKAAAIVSREVRQDDLKKAAGQPIDQPSVAYQNEIRKRIGLDPIDQPSAHASLLIQTAASGNIPRDERGRMMDVRPGTRGRVSGAFGMEERGGFMLPHETQVQRMLRTPVTDYDKAEQLINQQARDKVVSEAGGLENIDRIKRDYVMAGHDPSQVDQMLEQRIGTRAQTMKLARTTVRDVDDIEKQAGHLSSSFLSSLFNKSATETAAAVPGVWQFMGDLLNSESVRALASEGRKDVNKRLIADSIARQYAAGAKGTAVDLSNIVGNVVTLAGLSAVVGPEAAMSGLSGLSTLGQTGDYGKALGEAAKGLTYAKVFKALPHLERYPQATAAAQKLANLGVDASAVYTSTYALERATGKTDEEARHAAFVNSLLAGTMRLTEIIPSLKVPEFADRVIASESSPEWLRTVTARATGKRPAVVTNESETRAASAYVDPKTNQQIVREISPDEAKRFIASNRPHMKVSDADFERAMPPAATEPAEVAPMNRQLAEEPPPTATGAGTPPPVRQGDHLKYSDGSLLWSPAETDLDQLYEPTVPTAPIAPATSQPTAVKSVPPAPVSEAATTVTPEAATTASTPAPVSRHPELLDATGQIETPARRPSPETATAIAGAAEPSDTRVSPEQSAGSRTVPAPEKPETIREQLDALYAGRRNAVLITPGEKMYPPRKGYSTAKTAVGTFIYDKAGMLTADAIKGAVESGNYHRLLGIVEPKSAETTRIVTARTPEGVEAQSAIVSPQNEAQQAAQFKETYPESAIETGGAEQMQSVVDEREVAPEGKVYRVLWADGRAVQHFTNKAAAEKFYQEKAASDDEPAPPELINKPKGARISTLDAQASPTEQPSEEQNIVNPIDRNATTPTLRVPRAKNLSPAHREIEDRFASALEADPVAMVNEYKRRFTTNGVLVINTDNARELSDDYSASLESRAALSAVVHEPASALAKEVYRSALAQPVGSQDTVLITGGGTGAGKSRTVEALVQRHPELSRGVGIAFDTNSNAVDSTTKIDQALASGRKVTFVGVYRDPVEALVNGALPRADKIGRTVPLENHAETHVGFAKTLHVIANHYGANPDVSILLIDNSRGLGNAQLGSLDIVKQREYDELLDSLKEALENEHQQGHIAERTYRGTLAQGAVESDGASGITSAERGGAAGTAPIQAAGESQPSEEPASELDALYADEPQSIKQPAEPDALNGGVGSVGPTSAEGVAGLGEAARVSDDERPDRVPESPGGTGADALREPDQRTEDGTAGSGGDREERIPQPGPAGLPLEPSALEAQTVKASRNQPRNALLERDYRMNPDKLDFGGKKEKFRLNIAAIQTLKQIEAEGRSYATPEEQEKLVRYVGWGGLPEVFNRWQTDPKWKKEHDQIVRLLGGYDSEEYGRAMDSTKNAHFTSPEVVGAIWRMVKQLGFEGGRTLEPALGTGNFFGMMPPEIHGNPATTMKGIELDPLTGRIAQLLYPSASVNIQGYQDYDIADNYYDLVTSNVPFSETTQIADKRYAHLRTMLHDYFFMKSLDKVRPGGLVAFITSTGTLDRQRSEIRKALAEKADLVAAFRLPDTAFKKNAGTEVTTDLIILRKRTDTTERIKGLEQLVAKAEKDYVRLAAEGVAAAAEEGVPYTDWYARQESGIDRYRSDLDAARQVSAFADTKWVDTKTMKLGGRNLQVNEYYHEHPENMLGTPTASIKMYGPGESGENARFALKGTDDFAERLEKAIESLPQGVYRPFTGERSEQIRFPAPEEIKQGAWLVRDGKLFRKHSGELVQQDATADRIARVEAMIPVRQAVRELFLTELGKGKAEVSGARARLNEVYDAFVEKHGPLNSKVNVKAFAGDPDGPMLLKLERPTKDGKYNKADIFRKSVVKTYDKPTKADSVNDAVGITLNETARLDLNRMGELLSKTPDQVEEELIAADLGYRDPLDGWVIKDEYLSGNLKKKLLTATEAAKTDDLYERNVEALTQAVKEKLPDVDYVDIDARVGANWIPADDLKQFAAELMQINASNFQIHYLPSSGTWVADSGSGAAYNGPQATAVWGTKRAPFMRILQAALDNKNIAIYDKVGDSSVLNKDATEAANAKVKELKEQFKDWVWQDDERRTRLHRYYNDNFNNIADRDWVGSGQHLTLPGLSPEWQAKLRPHVKDAVWRIVSTGKMLGGHEVGTGKTAIMVISAMELKRLGLARKSMIGGLNSTISGLAKEAREMYPNINMLVLGEKDINAKQRNMLMADIASSDYDLVIMGHSHIDMLPVLPETQAKYIREEMNELEAALTVIEEDAKESGPANESNADRAKRRKKSRNSIVKQLAKAKEKLEERLKAALANRRDNVVYFEQTGIDNLMVDECFPGATRVLTDHGLLRIDDIVNQHLAVNVLSRVPGSQRVEWKPVTAWFKRPLRNHLVKVQHETGSFICTPNHNIWTEEQGYIQAGLLQGFHTLRGVPNGVQRTLAASADGQGALLQSSMRRHWTARNCDAKLFNVPGIVQVSAMQAPPILFEEMFSAGSLAAARLQGANIKGDERCDDEREASSVIASHDVEQPNAQRCNEKEGPAVTAWQDILGARGQRQTDRAANAAGIRFELADGIRDQNGASNGAVPIAAASLQSRSRESVPTDRGRSGWQVPQHAQVAVPRPTQGERATRSRVVSVALHQRSGDVRPPDGGEVDQFVYDLEVADTHNYFADGINVSNSHKYKAVPVYTKRGSVKGIPTSRSDRATNMLMLTRWLQEQHRNRGVSMFSGTLVSNALTEVYTLQRFVQWNELKERGIEAFDAWANLFGETTTKLEYTTTGEYKQITRFNHFTNLPELRRLLGQVLDIRFASDLPGFKRPERKDEVISVPMSDAQWDYLVNEIRPRAEAVKQSGGRAEKGDDNMLSISTDARKSSMDMRLVRPTAFDDPGSKVNEAVAKILRNYQEHPGQTQMLFSDYGINPTPWGFSLTQDIINKLVKGGIPRDEIINFNELSRAQRGPAIRALDTAKARVAIGSTEKMGTGINAQTHLLDLHHIDAPWLPAYIEQRNGRGWRPGNENETVNINVFTTAKSFDTFMWQTVANKQRFIDQFMRGDASLRSIRDDDDELSFSQIMAVTSGNPELLFKMQLEDEVNELSRAARRHESQQLQLKDTVAWRQRSIQGERKAIKEYEADAATYEKHKDEPFSITVGDKTYKVAEKAKPEEIAQVKAKAAKTLNKAIDGYTARLTEAVEHRNWRLRDQIGDGEELGSYRGFTIQATRLGVKVVGKHKYDVQVSGEDELTVLRSMDAVLRQRPQSYAKSSENNIAQYEREATQAQAQLGKQFRDADKLTKKREELAAVTARLEAAAPEVQEAAAADEAETNTTIGSDADSGGEISSEASDTGYYLDHEGEHIPSATAKPATVPGYEGFDFFTHESADAGLNRAPSHDEKFAISEGTTGLLLARGPSRKRAVEKGAEILTNKVGGRSKLQTLLDQKAKDGKLSPRAAAKAGGNRRPTPPKKAAKPAKKTYGPGASTGGELSRPSIGDMIDPSLRTPMAKQTAGASEHSPTVSLLTALTQPIREAAGAAVSGASGLASTLATGDVMNQLRGWLRTLAGHSLPKTTLRDRLAGELGARYAASRAAAGPMADLFANDVLTGLDIDQAKFDALLKADNLLSIRDEFEKAGETENADNVNTLFGEDDFPFATEEEMVEYGQEPEVQEALARHIENWEAVIDPMYREAAGIDPDLDLPIRGKNFGARINLNPIVEGVYEPDNGPVVGPKHAGGPGGYLLGTLQRKTPFARKAYGTGHRYLLNYAETIGNTFWKQLEIANKRAFDDALVDSGNAEVHQVGKRVVLPDGEPTKAYPYRRKGMTIPGEEEGSTQGITQAHNIYVRESLAKEYAHAADIILDPYRGNMLVSYNKLMAKIALTGLTDATVHISNLSTVLMQVPGTTGLPLLPEALLSAMGRLDIPITLARTLIKAWPEVMARTITPSLLKNMTQMASLAEINAGRPKHENKGISGKLMGRAVQGYDRVARMNLDDAYRNLNRQGLLKDNETNRREFINQAGSYNLRTQGEWMRFLRQTWISPFATAGRTFATLGIRGVTLDPGVEASSTAAAAAMRGAMAAKWIGTLVLVGLMNYLLTRKLMGRPGTPIGAIDTGLNDHNGNPLYINVMNLTGQTRALRTVGLRGAIQAWRRGLPASDVAGAAARDITNTAAGPIFGPGPRFAFEAATGYQPAVGVPRQSETVAPGESQVAENVRSAAMQANPLLASVEEYRKPGGSIAKAVERQLPRFTLTPVTPAQAGENYPELVQRAQAREFTDWIIHSARAVPMADRKKWVDEQVNRLPETLQTEAQQEVMRRGVFAVRSPTTNRFYAMLIAAERKHDDARLRPDKYKETDDERAARAQLQDANKAIHDLEKDAVDAETPAKRQQFYTQIDEIAERALSGEAVKRVKPVNPDRQQMQQDRQKARRLERWLP